jgi:hypothetical protein
MWAAKAYPLYLQKGWVANADKMVRHKHHLTVLFAEISESSMSMA